MNQMAVVGEDVLCCAIGKRLVEDVLKWSLPMTEINTHGVKNFRRDLPRYAQIAMHSPLLCIADTDGQCPVEFVREWTPKHTPKGFLLRLAAPEIESWILADQAGIAEFFDISPMKVSPSPEALSDPKTTMVNLAHGSKVKILRTEMVANTGTRRPGTGYNLHLQRFVEMHWHPLKAATNSPSLHRAIRRLHEISHMALP
jgi:hypothetical protein